MREPAKGMHKNDITMAETLQVMMPGELNLPTPGDEFQLQKVF